MFLVGSFDGSGAVTGHIGVENPHIKICVLSSRPEPSRADVRRALSVVMAERWDKYSLLRGCSRGSVATLWQTLVLGSVSLLVSWNMFTV